MASFEDLPTETRILVLQHLSSIDLRSFLTSQARHHCTVPFPHVVLKIIGGLT